MGSHVLCPLRPNWETLPSQVSLLKGQQVPSSAATTALIRTVSPAPRSPTCAGVELTLLAPARLHLGQPCNRRKATQRRMEAWASGLATWRALGVKGNGIKATGVRGLSRLEDVRIRAVRLGG